ncbi:type II toxin-antitoxin system prevent-host-death family antitoxin [Granulicella sp. 5B5]|uniref:type II toxin-antitoxin system prevent-host-death family antitoxin n=1 Tax=Granulicella sp. 5B5 TaxID=1617967 RepID=UPI001C70F036|nr:type II toxin-antitoxin system prevent-host-death family antitoxin [Granulicella sp. 5B5]
MTELNITSAEFDHDPGAVMKAAEQGPVFITEDGVPTYVVTTFEHYMDSLAKSGRMGTTLAELGRAFGGLNLDTESENDLSEPADFS